MGQPELQPVGSNVQATSGDLALGLARLEGKLDALTQTTTLQLQTFSSQLQESIQDRRDIHREVDALKTWRAWLMGLGLGLSFVSGVTALHSFGLHP